MSIKKLKGKGQGLFTSTKSRVNIIHRWAPYIWPSSKNIHSCCCLDDIIWEALGNISLFLQWLLSPVLSCKQLSLDNPYSIWLKILKLTCFSGNWKQFFSLYTLSYVLWKLRAPFNQHSRPQNCLVVFCYFEMTPYGWLRKDTENPYLIF